jgi:hypothetical protein
MKRWAVISIVFWTRVCKEDFLLALIKKMTYFLGIWKYSKSRGEPL